MCFNNKNKNGNMDNIYFQCKRINIVKQIICESLLIYINGYLQLI